MKKVLLLENIDTFASDFLSQQGYIVESLSHAISEQELIERLREVHMLGIRSKTKVTKKVLAHAPSLEVIGTFCIGTDQIDLETCRQDGIAVFNAPYSNTRSVAELALGEIIMLQRFTFEKSIELHSGNWQKSATGSHEVRGRTLGIIGYGNIGQQLSVLAESLGMKVQFFDIRDRLPLGNAKKCQSLSELLSSSDVVSVHVDGRKENVSLIGEKEIEAMKDGAVLLNLSRGKIVDLKALAKSIKSGKIRGAAVDVFPEEPAINGEGFISPLQGLPNVILTPHIAGSTVEAQRDIAAFVSKKLHEYVTEGITDLAVVIPNERR